MLKKKGFRIDIAKSIVLTLIVLCVCIVIWLLTNKSETVVTETSKYGSISSLECESTSMEGAFFKNYNEQRVKHKIVATFNSNGIDNILYNYEGTYNSKEAATNAEAWLHGDYNKYFRDTGLNPESYSPNFSIVSSKLKIQLYSERSKLNKVVLPLFYLEEQVYDKLGELSGKDFEKLYENKGFSCTFRE